MPSLPVFPTTSRPLGAQRARWRLACRWLWAGLGSSVAAAAAAQLDLHLPAEHSAGAPPRTAAIRPVNGVEINYDLLADSNPAAGPGRLRGVVAVPHGSVVASVLVNPAAVAGDRLARLDTRWQADLPYPVQTLVVGDTVGSGGGWSRAVRYGGLRLGRAPMLRPGTVDSPQVLAPGSAALPRAHLLALSGGEDRAVAAARELLGAAPSPETVAVGTLAPLAAGASDYELEAGRLRSGWGTTDDQYGDRYAAAGYRQGLGLEFTAETRAEWTPDRVATGVELSRDFGGGATVRAVIAQSIASPAAAPALQGLRRGVAVEGRIADAGWNLAWDGFDRDFTPLAAVPGEPEARDRIRAGTTVGLWGNATATVSYAQQSRWTGTPESMVGLSARFPLIERTSLDLNYTHRQGSQPGWQAGLKLSVPLDAAPGN